MTESPQPGWYPDDTGRKRWWDGDQWTDNYQDAAAPQPPVATAPENPKAQAKAANAYAKASRPWYRKKRWIGLIAIVALIVVFSLTGGGSGDDGPKKVDASGKAVNDAGDKADAKAGSKKNPVAAGETVELEGTRYTVKSAKTAASVGDEFFKETAGGVYVVVELTIENTKDETKTFLSEAAKFIGGNDKKYTTDDDGTIAAIGDGEPLIFEDMQPDVPKTGLLVYDVPKAAAAGGVLQVSDLFGRGEAYIKLGLE